ncbi:MAG TPA: hypothetical protein VE621_05750, partial [Bryobacteraceae bacterium]|nr:hypothetical protein [Bryobacteraceae bacterium]
MPDTSASTRQITGDDIISELLRNQEQGLFKLRFTVLSPCIFHLYFHQDDYDMLRPVLRTVREEAQRALEERLETWNREAAPAKFMRMLGLDPGQKLEYKTAGGWVIELHPDVEGRLTRGDIEIYSELGTEPREELGAGEKTRLITKRDAEGAQTSRRERDLGENTRLASRTAYATLRYS